MAAARRNPARLEEYTRERVLYREASRVMTLGPPWLPWAFAPVIALIIHTFWPGGLSVALVMICAGAVAAGSWKLTQARDGLHARLMAPVSLSAAGLWLTAATGLGLTRDVLLVWFVAGGSLSYYWSHWLHARDHNPDAQLGKTFAKAFAVNDVHDTKVIKMEALPPEEGQGLEGEWDLPPGMTHDEFAKRVPNINAAARFPVGALSTAPNLRDSGRIKVSLVNPVLLEGLQPWPGPSAPRTSIARPIRVGTHANGKPELAIVVNQSRLIMGQTGSGKSFGWTWPEFAELMTRTDAGLLIFDRTKDEQTVGALRQGCHVVETDDGAILDKLARVHRVLKLRTRYLASKGLNRWVEGCGLSYLTVNLQEAPDIVNLLDEADQLDDFLSDIKAMRSAGGSFEIEVQRATFDQIPVIVRSQMGKVCFGVESDDDAAYGLSDVQQKRGCHPGDWGQQYPGRHYQHLVSTSDDLIAVEARSFVWGNPAEDGGTVGDRIMREHATRYPATWHPLDEITAEALADDPSRSPSAAPPGPDPVARQASTSKPAPAMAVVPNGKEDAVERYDDPEDEAAYGHLERDVFRMPGGGREPDLPDDEPVLPEGQDWVFDPEDDEPEREKMTPEAARACLDGKLAELRGRGVREFGLPLLADVLAETGMGEGWLYKHLARLSAEGVIRQQRTRPRKWVLRDAA